MFLGLNVDGLFRFACSSLGLGLEFGNVLDTLELWG